MRELWSETGLLTSEEGGDATVVVKEPGWALLGAERGQEGPLGLDCGFLESEKLKC